MNWANSRRFVVGMQACVLLGLGALGCTSRSEEAVGSVTEALETRAWEKIAAATPPSGRDQAAMAFDSGRGRTVLFGGNDNNGALGGTYEWDGSSWTQRCSTTPCSTTVPGARNGASMAFDATRSVSVMFGGRAGASDSTETWEWNGTGSGTGTGTWTLQCTLAACSGTVPAKRHAASLAFDSARNVSVLFGGFCSGTGCPAAPNNYRGDTWEWNGTAWAQKCTTAPCTNNMPVSRAFAHIAYDSARGVTVLFGGADANNADLQDTWEWNGTSWSQKCTTGCTSPPKRQAGVMAYDSLRKRTILFSGYSATNGGRISDTSTWEWDGTSWQNFAVSAPPSTQNGAMAFDSNRGRVVLFGGLTDPSNTNSQETWEYHSYGAACTLDSQCNSGHCVDKVCCETTCTGNCFSCNQAGKEGVCTAVKSAEDAGTCSSTKYCDAGGSCVNKLAAGAACSSTTQCAAGVCSSSDNVCCNSDCGGLCQSCLTAKTGVTAGLCSAVTIGTDPDTECSDQGAASCGQNGSCNGAGSCQKYAAATVCVAQSCTGTTQTNASTCNGSGTCQSGSSASCNTGYVCSGTACPTMCSSDGQCAVGYYCSNKACVLKQDNGEGCTATNQCKTGFCVDNVCCDKACSGTCLACTNAKKGSGPDGTCSNVANATDPDNECANPAANACAPGGFCDGGGACQAYVKNGAACGATTCSSGSQSGLACNGSGSCLQVDQVACTPFICGANACLTTCTKDADCTSGNYCNAGKQCVPKQAGGEICSADSQCANGICADQVCCDTRCDGLCESCKATEKASGNDGTCGSIKPGTDPGDECDDNRTEGASPNANSCTQNGLCDSGNKCQLYAHGVGCGAVVCSNNAVTGKICSGTGTCANDTTGVDCGNFVCAGTGCKNPCQADADCTSGNFCAPNGECISQKPNGAECSNQSECAESNCVDGYCCDSSCKGQCQACDNPSSHGICSPTKGSPHTGRAACDGEEGSECAGTCNGKNTAACTFPGSTTSCGVACENAQETDSFCDGNGTCQTNDPTPCSGNFGCDADTQQCKTSCSVDADCATKDYVCDDQGQCSPPRTSGPTCDGDHTIKTPGAADTDCGFYRCAGTTCKETCTSVDDCVSPAVCNDAHQCVAAEDAGSDASPASDSGCGCRAVGGSNRSAPHPVWAGLLLALVAVRRVRRRPAA